ncbi:hypothetical protein QBC35DRAFT_82509 [Podospora australis]|uniref:NACHT-NTPase and P-loop NTPases N-terminal domain-containing protein n=1 Tax=Podospora australis TaxID=1536484 RepID=A0AAN6X055_9PEZI|nr:hypothetical protein QBC35DRAFT_82509 [Podospora australis]
MSGFEALGAASSIITIVEVTLKLFDALKEKGKLSGKFKAAEEDLNFVAHKLEKFYDSSQHRTKQIRAIEERCRENVKQLQDLLRRASSSVILRLWNEQEVEQLTDAVAKDAKDILDIVMLSHITGSSKKTQPEDLEAKVDTLLDRGYAQYTKFKSDDDQRVYQRLNDAIATYNEALGLAKNSQLPYPRGIIRCYISLAECYREQSHDHNLTLSGKLSKVNKAEECLQKAIRLADKHRDTPRSKRAALEQAVLDARKLLIMAKNPDEFTTTTRALHGKARLARRDLKAWRQEYKALKDYPTADWAKYWIETLEEAGLL